MPPRSPHPRTAGIGIAGPLVAPDVPSYYEDDEGQQVAICLDFANPNCGALALPEPTNPPGNTFPAEAFYQRAEAVASGVQLLVAQEMTYDGTAGSEGVFGRVRIRDLPPADLTPGQWYRFTYPGGQFDIQAADQSRTVDFTSDVGCGPAIGTPCNAANFAIAGGSDIGTTWLQKDRRNGAAAPASPLLADNGAPQAVVGSKFVPAGETTPANYFRIERITGLNGAVTGLVGQANEFNMLVPGSLFAGAPAGSLINSSGQLGNQRINVASTGKTVTLSNAGSGNVQLASLASSDPTQFAIDGADCLSKTPLVPGESCSVPVAFTPSAAGARSAQINVTETTAGGPKVRPFKLLGTGVQPILTLPAPLAFGSQNVGALTGPRVIAVRNTGTDTMHVNSATLGGTDAADYSFGNNACNNADVAPGAQCTVEVFFTPQAAGARSAALNISSDAGAGSLPLSGSGVAAAAGPGAAAGAAVGTPAAANTGQSAATATALKLKSLGGPTRIKRSKARQSGIRLSMRLPDGAKVVRIKIYRKTSSGLKLLTTTFKSPLGTTGVYHVTQSQSALRKAFKRLGNYQAEVTPGTSKTALGTASRLSFKIVR